MKKPMISAKTFQKVVFPVLLPALVLVLLAMSLSDVPLIERVTEEALRGEAPEVRFLPSTWLYLLVGGIFSLVILVGQAFRLWSQYFLSRKLVLSYLFFALIPLLTAIMVFLAGIRVMVGVSSLLTFETAMDKKATHMQNIGERIIRDISKDMGNLNASEVVETAMREGGRQLLGGQLQTQVYWHTSNRGGASRYLVQVFPNKGTTLFEEGSPLYEQVLPLWMDRDQWLGMVDLEGGLGLRYLQRTEELLLTMTLPINQNLVDQLEGFQVVQLNLASEDGTYQLTTAKPQRAWYQRLPLPELFATRWDNGAFDWNSGFFRPYGHVTFALELGSLDTLLDSSGLITFFYSGQKLSSVKVIVGILLLVFAFVLVASVFGAYLVGYITRSLNLLADGHERIKAGELVHRLPYIGKDQLGAMGTSFNHMASAIQSLMSQAAEKEKYHEELRIARRIQMSLLPDTRDLNWCSNIAANCIPAHDVGGDYYEIVRTENGEIGIFIADVSGKGTSAAFYMAEMKGVLIALRHLWPDPHALMMAVNEIMSNTLSSNVFISAAYLLLDPTNQQGYLARAGHCPAFHVYPDGRLEEIAPPGMAIGLAGNNIFGKILKVSNFPLSPQDKVILYTDGLDEMTHGNELYGLERLRNLLRENSHLSVESLKETILADVLGFLSDDIQNDDLTLVVAGLPIEAEIQKEAAHSETIDVG